MRRAKILPTILAAVVILVTAAPRAAHAVKLDEVEVFIEINATDGDAGIQIFLDGEGWKTMDVFDPDGNLVMKLKGKGAIREQGLTEFFFESAEPSFDEQPLEEFLALHPPGRYRFVGRTTDNEEIKGKARLTHDLPDAPMQVFPLDEEVDPEDAEFTWAPVADPPGSEIVRYEVVVECETEEEEFVLEMSMNADATSVTVPPEFLEQEEWEECKWELIAVEASGNRTISEAEFEVG